MYAAPSILQNIVVATAYFNYVYISPESSHSFNCCPTSTPMPASSLWHNTALYTCMSIFHKVNTTVLQYIHIYVLPPSPLRLRQRLQLPKEVLRAPSPKNKPGWTSQKKKFLKQRKKEQTERSMDIIWKSKVLHVSYVDNSLFYPLSVALTEA